MSDKGKGRATLTSDSPYDSATGVDRSLAGQTASTDQEEIKGAAEKGAGVVEGRSADDANKEIASFHRSSATLSPDSPTNHPPLPQTASVSSLSLSSRIPTTTMQSQPPEERLSDSLDLLLRCPLCRPPRLLQSPHTLRCGHTVCGHHIVQDTASTSSQSSSQSSTNTAHSPPCPINLPSCATVYATGPQNTYVHPRSGVVVGMAPAPPAVAQPDSDSAPSRSSEAPSFSFSSSTPTSGSSSSSGPRPLRVDVTTSKLLSLVSRARTQSSEEEVQIERVPTYGEDPDERTDSEGDDDSGSDGHDVDARHESDDDDLYADPPPTSTPSRSRSPPPHRTRKRRRRHITRPSNSSASRPSISRSGPSAGDAPIDQESRFEKELLTELTCMICFALMWKPITTPCQHTFCCKCLQRALDHSPACPLCRDTLPSYGYFDELPCNKVILSILLKAFPESYEERGRAVEEEDRNARLDIPIFVWQLSFPGMPTVLHFFEPRYRLMLRRCLASPNPCFGMIPQPRTAPSARSLSSSSISAGNDYGTMLAIRNVTFFADGRSIVETWGTWRFRVMERGTMDGYLIGRVERLEDWEGAEGDGGSGAGGAGGLPVTIAGTGSTAVELEREREAESEEGLRRRGISTPTSLPLGEGTSASGGSTTDALRTMSSLPSSAPREQELTNAELMQVCHEFLQQLREVPWIVERINEAVIPAPSDPALFSYWMALILPIDDHEKAKLLPIRSVRLRLRLVVHWIEQFNAHCSDAYAFRQVVRQWVYRLLTPLLILLALNLVLVVVWWVAGDQLGRDREELFKSWLHGF